ncbi:hypothetical protein CEXT_149641 [Caerostris extrusa]|uniref:Uncharacterized protein n=1 Tax=Caerostris extrusa TaxID=172846 RepID=A0AAV4XTK3_CAEEX|nr:hypothetical protein CEXT_149641 [Caerostris extrusa]
MVAKFNYSTITSNDHTRSTRQSRGKCKRFRGKFSKSTQVWWKLKQQLPLPERNCLLGGPPRQSFAAKPCDLSSKIKLLCFGSSWEDEGERGKNKLDNSEIRPFHSCFG